MRVLIVGAGGREHALASVIAKSKDCEALYCIGSNAGLEEIATTAAISLSDFPAITDFALKNSIDFAVIGPDDALVGGIVDVLEAKGIPCFGPTKLAARLEGSKAFAKEFMKRHHIPTPSYQVFTEINEAKTYVRTCTFPLVLKADGLALGKGVIIAQDLAEAEQTLDSMMVDAVFGNSGKTVVVEEFVTGPEVSLLVLTDGTVVKPLVSCMDHKRAFDNDEGPNTGGMGVIAPNPFYTESIAKTCLQRIVLPTINAMQWEGTPFMGCLFFGLMLTPNGPVVIEYNCRFGDPEAEAALTLLEGDALEILQACRNKSLGQIEVACKDGSACSVTVASGGYPVSYEKGKKITISALPESVTIFHAGTTLKDNGDVVTSGGRVLHVVGQAKTLKEAISLAYEGVAAISFEGKQYRGDIGKKALPEEV